jgi:hypothetical protein
MGSRELGTAPPIGFEQATLNTVGNAEALDGADFNLCSPAEPATLGFDATTQFMVACQILLA